VGLAVWADCSWFGYQCAEDYEAQKGAWRQLDRSFHGIKEPELCTDGKHGHGFREKAVVDAGAYHESAKMVRKVVHIV
jgi:hypothetical protein